MMRSLHSHNQQTVYHRIMLVAATLHATGVDLNIML